MGDIKHFLTPNLTFGNVLKCNYADVVRIANYQFVG